MQKCFNTVNGKSCCNQPKSSKNEPHYIGFNTVNGKSCCNSLKIVLIFGCLKCFNTVNGKSCCNENNSGKWLQHKATVSIP